jgi:hypothetical protein
MANIIPTVARMVHFRCRRPEALGFNYPANGQPLAAIVAHVHSAGTVNLTVFDVYGTPHVMTSVPLVQEGEEPPAWSDWWCEWMPYQKQVAAGAVQPTQHATPEVGHGG